MLIPARLAIRLTDWVRSRAGNIATIHDAGNRTNETTTRTSNRLHRNTISTLTLKCGRGLPLFEYGALTQTHPSKRLLEIDFPRIYGDLHTLRPLRYDNAITERAPRQDVHTIQAVTSSLDTIADLDSENTKSIPRTLAIQR